MKRCSQCKKEKELPEFYKNGKYLASACKECKRTNRKKWYREKNGYEKARDCWRSEEGKAARRRYWQSEKGKFTKRKIHLKEYGLTVEEWNRIYEQQKGRCAICGIHESELKRRLFIDHDHQTGETRSLLCHRCNSVIGLVEEDCYLLARMINYLEKGDTK